MSVDNFHLFDFARLFIRTTVLFALLPFGDGVVSHARKIALSFTVAVLLWLASCFFVEQRVIDLGFVSVVRIIFMDLLYGAVLALPLAVVVGLTTLLGELFDTVRGQSIATVQNPLLEGQYSMSATLIQFIVWSVLLSSGILTEVISLLTLEHALRSSELAELGKQLLHIHGRLLSTLLSMLIPVAAVCLALEVFHAAFQKFVFQLSGSAEMFALKTTLTISFYWYWLQPETGAALNQMVRSTITLLIG